MQIFIPHSHNTVASFRPVLFPSAHIIHSNIEEFCNVYNGFVHMLPRYDFYFSESYGRNDVDLMFRCLYNFL